jgi:hypothetical protein
MDLSKLSDKDLEAIAAGRMQDVSTAGLQMLAGEAPKPARPRSEELLRQLGLTARAGIEGVTSLPLCISRYWNQSGSEGRCKCSDSAATRNLRDSLWANHL